VASIYTSPLVHSLDHDVDPTHDVLRLSVNAVPWANSAAPASFFCPLSISANNAASCSAAISPADFSASTQLSANRKILRRA
jgi:hypothetical protein